MEWLDPIIHFFQEAVNPESIIKYGGLWLLFLVVFAETGLLVGFFLPGDSLLFTAGLLAANPKFSLEGAGFIQFSYLNVIVFITIAAVVGDNVGYYIGRRYGAKVFVRPNSRIFRPEYVQMTREFFDKHGAKALVLGRFIPIIRTFAPVLAGVAHLEYRRFMVFNMLGGIIWVVGLASLGFWLGKEVPEIEDYYEYIVIGFIVVTAIPLVRFYLNQRKENKNKKKTQQEINDEFLAEAEKVSRMDLREDHEFTQDPNKK